MLEEFDYTTKVLAQDLQEFQAFLTRENKEIRNKLASQTWARLTWEQRVARNFIVGVCKGTSKNNVNVFYFCRTNGYLVETLSQMQF
jgi:hypothetical protein